MYNYNFPTEKKRAGQLSLLSLLFLENLISPRELERSNLAALFLFSSPLLSLSLLRKDAIHPVSPSNFDGGIFRSPVINYARDNPFFFFFFSLMIYIARLINVLFSRILGSFVLIVSMRCFAELEKLFRAKEELKIFSFIALVKLCSRRSMT